MFDRGQTGCLTAVKHPMQRQASPLCTKPPASLAHTARPSVLGRAWCAPTAANDETQSHREKETRARKFLQPLEFRISDAPRVRRERERERERQSQAHPDRGARLTGAEPAPNWSNSICARRALGRPRAIAGQTRTAGLVKRAPGQTPAGPPGPWRPRRAPAPPTRTRR